VDPKGAAPAVLIYPVGPEPWKPMPDETAREYFCFKAYLDMGAGRTLQALSDAAGLPMRTLKALEVQRGWVERVKAWDTHVLELEFESREHAIQENGVNWEARRTKIREEAYASSLMLIEKARGMLSFPLEQETETHEERENGDGTVTTVINIVRAPAKWTLKDAATFLDTADKMQRLAADMSTSNANVNVTSRKIELTVKMLVQLMGTGSQLDAAKQKLIGVGMDASDVEAASKQLIQQNLIPQTERDAAIEVDAVEVGVAGGSG